MQLIRKIEPEWFGGPFLRSVSGKQIVGMAQAIKKLGVSGNMQLAPGADRAQIGTVSLTFTSGALLEEAEILAPFVGQSEVIMAWLPSQNSASSSGESDNADIAILGSLVPQLNDRLISLRENAGGTTWAAVLYGREVVASLSKNEDVLLAPLAGFIAEVNASNEGLMGGQPLRRTCLATKHFRIGFEAIGGPWSLVYRVTADSVSQIGSLVEEVWGILHENNVAQLPDHTALTAVNTYVADSQYMALMPDMYRKAQTKINLRLRDVKEPWEQIWFRYAHATVYTFRVDGESEQAIGTQVEELVRSFQHRFSVFVGEGTTDVSLHSDHSTVWCYGGRSGSFVALLFPQKSLYKSVADDMAKRCWSVLGSVFGRIGGNT